MLLIPKSFGELKDSIEGSTIEQEDVSRLLTSYLPVVSIPRRLTPRDVGSATIPTTDSFTISERSTHAASVGAQALRLVTMSPGLWRFNVTMQIRTEAGVGIGDHCILVFTEGGVTIANILTCFVPGLLNSISPSIQTHFNALLDRQLEITLLETATGVGESYTTTMSIQGSKLL